MDAHLSRRDFLLTAAALASGADALQAAAARPRWPGYGRAVVIDCLASPGPFNSPVSTDGPLTAEMLANVRGSGITAVNLTVSGGGAGTPRSTRRSAASATGSGSSPRTPTC
jgi:membrane dipeptidase